LIKHVFNDVCLVKLNNKIFIRFQSTITDAANPMLSRNAEPFGWAVRKMHWSKILMKDVERSEQSTSTTTLENFKKALLGNFGK
jgi:hypothetical protein